jgi:hypothetical protein
MRSMACGKKFRASATVARAMTKAKTGFTLARKCLRR